MQAFHHVRGISLKKFIWFTLFSVLFLIVLFATLLLSFEYDVPTTRNHDSSIKTFRVSTFEKVEPGRGKFITAYPATVIPRVNEHRKDGWKKDEDCDWEFDRGNHDWKRDHEYYE